MKKVFLAVIAVIVVLAGGLMLSYNGLAGSKEAVETADAGNHYRLRNIDKQQNGKCR